MGEQTPPATPTEVERELATEIVRHGQDGGRLVELVAVAVATARAAGHTAGYVEGNAAAYATIRRRIVEHNGSHDCAPCSDTGALRDGEACPLCDGYGKL